MTALAPSANIPTPGLVRAEILKLRKRRGLVATVSVLTVGAAILTYGIIAILHAVNPGHHGPAGGVTNLGHGLLLVPAYMVGGEHAVEAPLLSVGECKRQRQAGVVQAEGLQEE